MHLSYVCMRKAFLGSIGHFTECNRNPALGIFEMCHFGRHVWHEFFQTNMLTVLLKTYYKEMFEDYTMKSDAPTLKNFIDMNSKIINMRRTTLTISVLSVML